MLDGDRPFTFEDNHVDDEAQVGQMVIECVASNASSWRMTTGLGLPAWSGPHLRQVSADAPLVRLEIEPSSENGLRTLSRLMVDKITTVSKQNCGRVLDVSRASRWSG
jgi:hypothetical protein